jgi:hypothetical protein
MTVEQIAPTPEFWATYQSRLTAYRHDEMSEAFANYSLDALILLVDFSFEILSIIETLIVIVSMSPYELNVTIEQSARGLASVVSKIP